MQGFYYWSKEIPNDHISRRYAYVNMQALLEKREIQTRNIEIIYFVVRLRFQRILIVKVSESVVSFISKWKGYLLTGNEIHSPNNSFKWGIFLMFNAILVFHIHKKHHQKKTFSEKLVDILFVIPKATKLKILKNELLCTAILLFRSLYKTNNH